MISQLSLFKQFKEKSFLTNHYSVDSELFANNGKCIFEFRNQDGLICIFKESDTFFKRLLFFIYKEKLEDRVLFFENEDLLVTEIVFSDVHNFEHDSILNWLSKNDFFHYRTFVRMFKIKEQKVNKYDFSSIIKPTFEDINEIHNQLINNFDILSERVPTTQELIALKDSSYIIKKNGELASILISEIKGKTEELRYWLVLPKFRDLGYGGLLMNYFLSLHQKTIRFTLWVDVNNVHAINIYEKYGFRRDKLINKIFINIKIMKTKILSILKETRPEFQFDDNTNFVDAGYLDSFDLITIVSDLESTFDVKINGSLIVPESFQSIESIMNLVQISKNASSI